MPYLFSIGAALSSFFFLLIISRKKKETAHYILALIFFLACLNVIYLLLYFSFESSLYIPVLTELHFSIPVVYGGLIYLFTYESSHSKNQMPKQSFLLAGIFITYFIYTSLQIHLNLVLPIFWTKIFCLGKPIINIVYLSIALLHFYAIKNPDRGKAKWLLWLIIGGLIMCAISLLGVSVSKAYPDIVPMHGDYLIGSFLSIYFFVLGLIVFRDAGSFQTVSKPHVDSDKKNYYRAEFDKLSAFMLSRQLYLDPTFTIHKLSSAYGMPVNKVSEVINNHSGSNFHDFVNRYRITEVKQKMADDNFSHLSILGMALDTGFNSKASFNRAFKKQTGVTPSAYRRDGGK